MTEQGFTKESYSDTDLIRFLRARKYRTKKVYEMWDNFLRWRKDNDMDNVLVRSTP